MADMWHLSKFDRRSLSKEVTLTIGALLGNPATEDEVTVEARCGVRVQENQLRTYEQYEADKGANADMWCPLCFGVWEIDHG